jgi:tetratricopeptide (TPR) repeat protein
MDNVLLIIILKRTYKILIVLALVIIFFLGYNMYLIDYSLANLKLALNKVSDIKTQEEAKKLASALDYSLFNEVASRTLQSGNIAKIELAKDILNKSRDVNRLKDVKYALQEVINQKERERPAVLVALDKLSSLVTPGAKKVSKTKLEDQARDSREKIGTLRDRDELQNAYYVLANTYTQLSEFEKAKEAYQKAMALNPDSDLAKKSQFNLAWNEKNRGNLDEAIKEFEKLSQTPGEEKLASFSKYQLAETYRKKEDYEKAVSIYREIASKDKELGQISNLQTGTTLLYDLKQSDKAREVFEKTKTRFKGTDFATRIDDTMAAHLVSQYRREGFKLLGEAYDPSYGVKYTDAVSYFDKALAIDPGDAASYAGKAICLLSFNEPDKALEFAHKAVELDPNDEIASVNLGYIYIEMGMVNKAIAECKRFLSLVPSSPYSYYNLGYAYAGQNKIEEAISAFRQATKIDPQFVFAYNNLGWCLWQLGNYGEAIEAFENALRLQPKFLDALFNLGATYEAVDRYEDAKRKFQAVLEIDPRHFEAQYQLRGIEKFLQEKDKEQK